ncbi:MAG: putative metal-dependent hydrolase [Candidatus Doudnabacteria bacterium]|nr:putative metal-dependent hydrolase [Candidatus Doudnabacteria bacterium]
MHSDGRVVLTMPKYASMRAAEKFLALKKEWILAKITTFQKRPKRIQLSSSKKDYLELKSKALILAKDRLNHFNSFYALRYNQVRIRDQKSRWGSCSKKGNLTFNFRIALLPEELLDYIIAHELCHIKEFNHSKNFWNLVGLAIPNYSTLKKELHKYSLK